MTVYHFVMVFNATVNNMSVISWQSVLLLEESVYEQKSNPVTDHWDTLS